MEEGERKYQNNNLRFGEKMERFAHQKINFNALMKDLDQVK